jgi:hypothetical protein
MHQVKPSQAKPSQVKCIINSTEFGDIRYKPNGYFEWGHHGNALTMNTVYSPKGQKHQNEEAAAFWTWQQVAAITGNSSGGSNQWFRQADCPSVAKAVIQ